MRQKFWLCGLALLSACAGPDNQTQLRGQFDFSVADRERTAGDYAGAAVYYQAAENVDAARAKAGEGACFLAMGKPADAEKAFRAQDCAACQSGLGIALLEQNRPREAIALARDNLGKTPNDNAMLQNLGLMLALDGQFDEAIAFLKRALSDLPNDRRARLNLALAYGLAGRFDDATLALKTVTKDPAASLAYYARLQKMPNLARIQALVLNASP